MKTFAHFLSNGKSQLGSDAWCRLDGRQSLEKLCQDARDQMQRLSKVRPHYNGFEIHQGLSLSHTTVIHRLDKA